MLSVSADNLVDAANVLAQIVAHSGAKREQLAREMRDAEHRGDEATHGIFRRLNSSFVTPLDREDIYRLAVGLDDCMDEMDAAADLIVLYELHELPTAVTHQVEVLQRAAKLTSDAIPRLRAMRALSDYWIEINRLENEADKTHRRLVARLFSGAYDALTVLKLKGVVDTLEAAADAFESVAHTVETIAVKES
jgi:predicted phosphate transport protein (TIGR00153 family)